MSYLPIVSYCPGGACFTNAIPHLISGLRGRPFPSLFSKPVGVGLSSPVVNFVWGWASRVIGYVLIFRVGEFSFRSIGDVLVAFLGSLIIGVMLARHFGTLYGGKVTAGSGAMMKSVCKLAPGRPLSQ